MTSIAQPQRPSSADDSAVVLAHNLLRTPYAKTAHGMIRHGCRWRLACVIDPSCAGEDAGHLLDGRARGIPVLDSIAAALTRGSPSPRVCIVGVATPGGTLPAAVRTALSDAAAAGLTLVNGLHELLADDAALVRAVEAAGGHIVDIRAPRPARELRFWLLEQQRLMLGVSLRCLLLFLLLAVFR